MRRGRTLLLLLLLVVIIGAAAAYFFVFQGGNILGGSQQTATPAVRLVPVVVAGQQIPKTALIDEGMLTTVDLPEDKVVSTMIRDKAEVVGKYAKYQLDQGHFITTADIAESSLEIPQGGSEAARLVPPGLVAISIPMDRLGLDAYGIRDGDHINLILTALFIDVDPGFQSILPNIGTVIEPGAAAAPPSGPVGRTEIDPVLNLPIYVVPSEAQRPRLVSQMILQDVQVLHVGDFKLPEEEAAAQPAGPQVGPTPTPTPNTQVIEKPTIITLIVSPQDAVTLTYLMYSGAKMNLALRGVDDQSRVQTESATLQFLLSQYGITIPAKLSNVMVPVPDLSQEVVVNP
jgi:pilus assembly protein CpaB